jgi:hypothetical protein
MGAPQIIRRASRLARLLDDTEALDWLKYEVQGYPADGLDAAAVEAATRSGRQIDKDGKTMYRTITADELQSMVDDGAARLRVAQDAPVSISSANPNQVVVPPSGNRTERGALQESIIAAKQILGKIVGAVHSYASERYVELRFGAAMESAFGAVRTEVDAQIAELAPNAATALSAAFEDAASDNPLHWANASAACRRLLKEIADTLRPAGPPVSGRTMADGAYINRLIDWIQRQSQLGGTVKDVVTADLADFGKRIDAVTDAGNKGAHTVVTRYEASRFIAGAYLLVGDILTLRREVGLAPQSQDVAVVQSGQ